MSEYQYYEFQALDRPLDDKARAALRQITSRAKITGNSLINEYHFGDFKGNPAKLMEQYFDAFLYLANWGSRTIMLRLPLAGLSLVEVEPYCLKEEGFSAWNTKEHLILSYEYRNEGGDSEYLDEDTGNLASIIPIREELMRGDHRALYLGWLLAAQQSDSDEENEFEPPVPPGLKSLSAAQQALANFLPIDSNLIAAAAERSANLGKGADPGEDREQADWLKRLPAGEKDAYLLQLLRGEGAYLGAELRRRFRDEPPSNRRKGRPSAANPAEPRRSVAELRKRTEQLAEEERERQRQKTQREREEAQRRRAQAREQHLASLAGKENSLWRRAEDLVATRQPGKYDEAVQVLGDLRELARRANALASFTSRLTALREKHASKRTFLERLGKAGLA